MNIENLNTGIDNSEMELNCPEIVTPAELIEPESGLIPDILPSVKRFGIVDLWGVRRYRKSHNIYKSRIG